MSKKIGQAGLEIIKSFEGCRLEAYKCPAGVWTIGYGHTGKVDGKAICKGMKITNSKATELLKEDVAKFEDAVEKYDDKYKWNQNQFDALVSFAFNVGSIDQLTANGTRTVEEISNKIPAYNKAGGKVLEGLKRRRTAEKELFDTKVVKQQSSKKTNKNNKKEDSETPKCPYKEPTKTIRQGQTGNSVRWLQWHLIQLGYMSAKNYEGKSNIDGDFGSLTLAGVRAFQKKYPECGTNGKPDGEVGEKSRAKLKSLIK